jgi:hypothetical protein
LNESQTIQVKLSNRNASASFFPIYAGISNGLSPPSISLQIHASMISLPLQDSLSLFAHMLSTPPIHTAFFLSNGDSYAIASTIFKSHIFYRLANQSLEGLMQTTHLPKT